MKLDSFIVAYDFDQDKIIYVYSTKNQVEANFDVIQIAPNISNWKDVRILANNLQSGLIESTIRNSVLIIKDSINVDSGANILNCTILAKTVSLSSAIRNLKSYSDNLSIGSAPSILNQDAFKIHVSEANRLVSYLDISNASQQLIQYSNYGS